MSPSLTLPVITLFFAALAYLLLKAIRARRIRALMPPGPPGIPFLGNALQLHTAETFRQFAEWGNTYGPIISLDIAGKSVVIVNSLKTANDLFDRRSAIYNDRPRLIMAFELLLDKQNIALMPYGHAWRKQRRAVHEAMNIRDVRAYNPLQERAAVNLVLQLLSNPDDWRTQCNRAIASSVTSIVYGIPLGTKSSDELLSHVFEAMDDVARFTGSKNRYMVEMFPSMLLLPDWLAKWKREAVAASKRYSAIFEGLYESARLQMHKTSEGVAFCCHLMRNEDQSGLSARDAAWLAAMLLLAGIDTSSGMLSVFFLSMLRNPDVMLRAHAEIDAVIGRDRLPTLDDLEDLPYTYAIVYELLRWWPVAPMSLPHFTTEDDWYNGFFIPKGTTVLQNLWAMGRNTEDFPEPDCFRPERFLHKDSDGKTSVQSTPQKPLAFGFGRRICPGANVAMRNLFIEMACILWAFDIQPSSNEKGEPIVPSDTDWHDDGLILAPLPFPCVIRPRSHGLEQIVRQALQADPQ